MTKYFTNISSCVVEGFQISIEKLKTFIFIKILIWVEIQGVRDYIHITDLAVGHILSLKKIEENPGLKVWTKLVFSFWHWLIVFDHHRFTILVLVMVLQSLKWSMPLKK